MITSGSDTRKDLLDKYKETQDSKYMDMWKESEGPIVYSMRLSNMVLKENKYLSERLSSDVPLEIKKEMQVNNPDLLAYAYITLMGMVDSWNPLRGSMDHFVYNYIKKNTVRLIHRDLNKSSQGNGDLSLEHNNLIDAVIVEGNKLGIDDILKNNIEEYATRNDIAIIREMMGEIDTAQAYREMGYTSVSAYYRRKKHFKELAKSYLLKSELI